MSRHPLIGTSLVLVLLTVVFTWPQCLHLSTKVVGHHDAYFSTWRLAWIAHALRIDPRHLYDANIFYPETRTLAYSDATLLEGAIATPLLWAGVRPILAYNLVLLVGIASSGLGMFVLVRYLTKNPNAGVVSAAIFTLVPYRIDHIMHLELQWAVWMPLAFWAAHRAVDEGSWRLGALAGVFAWLQVLSCVYYGIFLATMLTLFLCILIATEARARAALPYLLLGAIVATLLTLPYSRPYVQNMGTVGVRPLDEIQRYSATPLNYLATPSQNWLWGWTAARLGETERHLFPGVIAIALGVIAFAQHQRRLVWLYAAICLLAVELSFGLNGHAYSWLHAHVPALRGLRSAARVSIMAYCALAVMAGFGFACVEQRMTGPGRHRRWLVAAVVLALTIEYQSAPIGLASVPSGVPDIYRYVQSFGQGVIAEFPMTNPAALPGDDPQYVFWSITHWRPLVNGYSGYVSPFYVDTLERMLTFPDDQSIARLRELKVRCILVHESLYKAEAYSALMMRIGGRPELTPAGKYRDWVGWTQLLELKP